MSNGTNVKETTPFLTGSMVNWLIAIIIGVIIPWLVQPALAVVIGSFNTLPEMSETVVGMTTQVASLLVSIFLLVYIIGLAYQVWFIGRLGTHSSVFALVLSLFAPFSIWFLVPLIFNL